MDCRQCGQAEWWRESLKGLQELIVLLTDTLDRLGDVLDKLNDIHEELKGG